MTIEKVVIGDLVRTRVNRLTMTQIKHVQQNLIQS